MVKHTSRHCSKQDVNYSHYYDTGHLGEKTVNHV